MVKKPRKPKWRRKGESLEAFGRRQHKYVDRLIGWMEQEARLKRQRARR